MTQAVDQATLKHWLRYDKRTGVFTWRRKPHGKMQIGDVAGTLHVKGYIQIGIQCRTYRAHRLAWLYVHGCWPQGEIDHRDGQRANNRIKNLRDATTAMNRHNHGANAKGWQQQANKFVARIKVGNETCRIGAFDTPEEAHAMYTLYRRMCHEGYLLR